MVTPVYETLSTHLLTTVGDVTSALIACVVTSCFTVSVPLSDSPSFFVTLEPETIRDYVLLIKLFSPFE